MSLFRSAAGMIQAKLTGADIYGTLKLLSDHGVTLHELEFVDVLTVRFVVSRQDYHRAEIFCRKYGSSLHPIRRLGIHWPLVSFIKRPVLLGGLLLLVLAALYLPSRVLIIQVQGNERIPQQKILEAAANCGIRFGASRRLVRSEQMKNSLLGTLPDLQWAGINTYGCRAVISVHERQPDAPKPETADVSSIVAAMDGVLTDCTAVRGTALCRTGQAVTRGQMLISGYTDCGITIKATRAEGEIIALTKRELAVVTPSEALIRTGRCQTKTFYSLILGKKRINFYKGSGISGGSCVKMNSKYDLTLPGGFELPLSLIKETVVSAAAEQLQVDNPEQMLCSYAQSYLSDHMEAGQILEKEEQINGGDGVFRLFGQYSCLESIGMRQEEMIGERDG